MKNLYLLILVVMVFGVQSIGLCQNTSEETLTIFLPNAVGYYYNFVVDFDSDPGAPLVSYVSAPAFWDNALYDEDTASAVYGYRAYEDRPYYNVDPSEDTSAFRHLEVGTVYAGAIYNDDGSGVYQIFPAGQTRLNSIHLDGGHTLTMNAASPGATRAPKDVWPDIAEGVNAEDTLNPADVVSLDPNNPDSVIKSQKPYQSDVAGIISTKPSFYMAAAKEQKPLALCGRVLCNVVDENGPITPGDLLVTSSTPGCAMKADPAQIKPGTVIGKALQGFDGKGPGKIIVLVNSR